MTAEDAARAVQAKKDALAQDMQPEEYKEFLEELVSHADGWRMELEDME